MVKPLFIKFLNLDEKEKERITSICKNVASDWLDFVNKNNNENEYSFDSSKQRSIVLNYRPCTDGKPFKSWETCKDVIISLITQLAPFDFLSLSFEFSTPTCIFVKKDRWFNFIHFYLIKSWSYLLYF